MDLKNEGKTYKIIMAVIITALVTALATTVIVYNYFVKTDTGKQEVLSKIVTTSDNSLTTKIKYIRTYLDTKYVGTIDEEKVEEGALQGYVNGLGDQYTQYLTQDEYESLLISVNGDYVGIGIYMAQNIDKDIVIVAPIEGSPAEEAKLKTGDIIEKVNGEECHGVDSSVVASKIKGEAGTTVELEILRDNETFTVQVERRKIEIKYMDSKVLENNIGYLQILSFDTDCSVEFKNQLDSLLNKGIKSLIIDLRGNGGGVVQDTITMAETFIPKDNIIMKTYDKNGKETIIKSENSNPEKLNMVVLVDENSASASEIFTAAMKDNNVATIIGTTTYGKGCMQELDPLTIGGALKITIQEFRTPNGDVINNVGIKPNIEVKNDEDSDVDLQLQKAIEYLKNM